MRAHPAVFALAGAVSIAFTGTLVRLADVEPATAAFYRCAYALPLLAPIAFLERRRLGEMGRRRVLLSVVAGLFFAADLELWHHAIAAVGAGLSTVVSNLQVVVVGLVAWLALGERPSRRVAAAVPVAMLGVTMIAGVGGGGYGERPVAGVVYSVLTAVAYAGFLLCIREAGRDLRPPGGTLFVATASCAAALAVVGPLLGELHLDPTWPAHGWLAALAISAQVVGYFAITLSLPRLPALVASILLLAQPVLSVGIAALVVDERPSPLQLLGVVLVIAAMVIATSRGAGRAFRAQATRARART